VFANVDEYVAAMGGKRPIRRLLLCNNGIAAVKCIRSIRKWSYNTFGSDKAVQVGSPRVPAPLLPSSAR
jgi:acetyl-CoA carboxylase/biotin carboxylase 1